MLSRMVVLSLLILSLTLPAAADETERGNQLLYRNDGQLYLYDVASEQAQALPNIETRRGDSWLWSPDGEYLLSGQYRETIEQSYRFLKLYDLAAFQWLLEIPVDSFANSFGWSPDSQQFAYEDFGKHGGQLRVYNLTLETDRLLYKTEMPRLPSLRNGIGDIWWSPRSDVILFISHEGIGGGFINSLMLINLNDGNAVYLWGEYYAVYSPRWSPDGNWIIVTLETVYVANGLADESEFGDLYLINAITGQMYQITNTPQAAEYALQWSADSSRFQFIAEDMLYTIDVLTAIRNIEEAVVTVESAPTTELSQQRLGFYDSVSPDGAFVAYLTFASESRVELYIANLDGTNARLITTLASEFDFLGWRP